MAHGDGSVKKKVAIIGAGCSGLTTIKCCLDEGLTPVCFELSESLGGLWSYCEENKPDCGSVYKSCVINTSKETVAFSDFPVPTNYPPFMPHHLVLEYFRNYASHFDLERHIRYATCVDSVQPTEDHDVTGRWYVTSRRSEETQSAAKREVFDAVMVCSGHHVYPHAVTFEGQDNFLGTVIHSHDYKVPLPYEDKRVLVVGIGNSAVDIAVDISTVSKQVHLSTRRGAWIVSRMGPFGLAADAVANSRMVFTLPRNWLQKMVEVMANFRFDHEAYGIKPKHRSLEAHPTINDELPYKIMTGKVQVRPNIAHFTPEGVVFEDGSYQEIDAVVMATGYDYKFKFLDPSTLNVKNNQVDLFKYVFPADRPHPTLAIIGLVQAIGSVMPISEMQARWATRVFNGKTQLPSMAAMLDDIRGKRDTMASQYLTSRRHTLETFWIEYMDELAGQIGVKPKLWKLLLKDPFLALRCFAGPCTAAQYRLEGPGKWEGAPRCIRKILANYEQGTKTRYLEDDNDVTNTHCWPKKRLVHFADLLCVVTFFVVMACIYHYFIISLY